MGDETEYITTSEASETLGYTIQHTRRLVRDGRLHGTKMGRDWLILRESVAEYVTRSNIMLPINAPKRGRPRSGGQEMNDTTKTDAIRESVDPLAPLVYDYPNEKVGRSTLVLADCFEWLARVPENTLHAIVTDPPYGVKEYESEQLEKRENGHGGIWRIPPSFDGSSRSPLPRFTALNAKERSALVAYFVRWSELVTRALRPGGHVFIASNSFLSNTAFSALGDGGLEFRGELIRLVRTLRGGNRPKNAEEEFPGVCSTLRGAYEPWGIFRKPLPSGMKVSDCLLEYQTGGLRRGVNGAHQFTDVIASERTAHRERGIADHPSLKPQSLLRQLVYMALPLGVGIIADPFMGSGSTVAAAEAMGLVCIGVERYERYYEMALHAVPKLAALPTKGFSFYDEMEDL